MSDELRPIAKSTAQAICDAVKAKEGTTEGIPFNLTLADRIAALPSGVNKFPQVVDRTVTEITAEDLVGVTRIGKYAFTYCDSLTSVTIPNSVTSISDNAFSYCDNLASVTTGNGVTSIGDYAFYDCDNLTSVTIPNSVTSIGDSAFAYCDSLKSVYYDGDIASWCNISFGNYYANPLNSAGKLYIKKSGTNEYELLTNLVIPDSVTEIKDYAFYGCASLTSVTIPDGVMSIGKRVFSYCTNLTSVTIGNGVTSIGEYVFNRCATLSSVRIGSGITSISTSNIFNGCAALTDIYIDAEEDSISGAPWGATNATVHWNTPLPTEEA